MSTPTSKSPSTTATKNPDAAKAVESPKSVADGKPAEPAKAGAPAASDGGKSDTKTIVSITVNEKLARQARLLAKVRGVTISSLFVEAAARTIPVALKAALASIKDEVE